MAAGTNNRWALKQRERMDQGLIYDPANEEIVQEQTGCLDALYEYNTTRPSEPEKRSGNRHCAAPESLDDWLKKQDDSFAVTLLKLIAQKGMTDVQCYKKANVGKKTFWKITNAPPTAPANLRCWPLPSRWR